MHFSSSFSSFFFFFCTYKKEEEKMNSSQGKNGELWTSGTLEREKEGKKDSLRSITLELVGPLCVPGGTYIYGGIDRFPPRTIVRQVTFCHLDRLSSSSFNTTTNCCCYFYDVLLFQTRLIITVDSRVFFSHTHSTKEGNFSFFWDTNQEPAFLKFSIIDSNLVHFFFKPVPFF